MLRNNAVARRCSYFELGLPVALACCDTVRAKSTFGTFLKDFGGNSMEKVLVVTCSCLLRTIYITNWICESDVKDLAFMHEINVLSLQAEWVTHDA